MATTPEIHSVESTPTTSQPRRDETHWVPVVIKDGKTVIAPAYIGLSEKKKAYILESARQNILASGTRMSNCFVSGSIFARTKDGRYAKGYRLTCGEMFCEHCGLGDYRLQQWMNRRDPEKIYSRKQVGMELGIPMNTKESWQDAYARLWFLARLLASCLCYPIPPGHPLETPEQAAQHVHVVVRNATPRKGFVYIRIVMVADSLDCAFARRQWAAMVKERGLHDSHIKFASPEGVIGRAARHLFRWLFSGMDEAVKTWTPEQQVTYRKAMFHVPCVDSTGNHYSPMSEEEVKAKHEAERQRRIEVELNSSGKGEQWEYIPLADRTIERCDLFESRFERVDWGKEFYDSYRPHTNHIQSDDPPA